MITERERESERERLHISAHCEIIPVFQTRTLSEKKVQKLSLGLYLFKST